MHVSGHFRPLPLQTNAPAQPRATRKKLDEADKVPPVERRFSEDEPQEERRQQQSWQSKSHRARDETVASEEGKAFAEIHNAPSSGLAAPTVQGASLQRASPLDSLLAGMRHEAPPPSEAAAPKPLEAAAEPSLDDLLALMRAQAQKS